MTADGRVQIGLVGLGYWGPNLARNIVGCPRAELKWACDLRPDILAGVESRYPRIRTTTRFEEMIADPELDAVAIATSVSTHYALASAALDAGKHVYVEKPMASSSSEAIDLIERAARGDLVLLPGHTFLYSPPVLKIKELIDAGEVGDVYFISMSRVNLGLHQPDISVVWDLAPHDFSILRFWLGAGPTEVTAMARACVVPHTPDVSFINVRFGSGTIAHLELAWLAPSKLRRTAIVGSERMIVYDDTTSSEPVRIFDAGAMLPEPGSFGEYQLSYRTGDVLSPKIEPTEPLSLAIADFCEAILEGSTPKSTPETGLDVILTLEAVERSLAAGGVPAPCLTANSVRSMASDLLRPVRLEAVEDSAKATAA
jgi:predicted dehydrogenase